MPEHRVESHVKLADERTTPMIPDLRTGAGTGRPVRPRRLDPASRLGHQPDRDVLRGGITGATKTAARCEAFGVGREVHMSGFANLHVVGADVCKYDERGLLAPGLDYDETRPTCRRRATRSATTATSPFHRHPASAIRSNGTTSKSTDSRTPESKPSTPNHRHQPPDHKTEQERPSSRRTEKRSLPIGRRVRRDRGTGAVP